MRPAGCWATGQPSPGRFGDDKTDTANQTVDRELGQGAQVIVGLLPPG